mgnify:CR=1 FL=1
MIFIAWTLGITASLLLMLSALAFLKARDIFTMTHVVMVANCYIIPLLLLAVEIERFSLLSFAKIATLISLNLVVANLLCHTILRRAVINKITPDAQIREDAEQISKS